MSAHTGKKPCGVPGSNVSAPRSLSVTLRRLSAADLRRCLSALGACAPGRKADLAERLISEYHKTPQAVLESVYSALRKGCAPALEDKPSASVNAQADRLGASAADLATIGGA